MNHLSMRRDHVTRQNRCADTSGSSGLKVMKFSWLTSVSCHPGGSVLELLRQCDAGETAADDHDS